LASSLKLKNPPGSADPDETPGSAMGSCTQEKHVYKL
jgi:hypothetical protein